MNLKTFILLVLFLTISLLNCSEKKQNKQASNLKSDQSQKTEEEKNPPFSFVGFSKCGHYENYELNMDAMDNYGRMKPYDIELIDTAGYTWVKFDAIFECCHEAKGSVNAANDSIILRWGVTKEGGCPCW